MTSSSGSHKEDDSKEDIGGASEILSPTNAKSVSGAEQQVRLIGGDNTSLVATKDQDRQSSGVTGNSSIRQRRSSRSSQDSDHKDPIIAPGFGTAKDIRRLADQLSIGNNQILPPEAVEAMMKSRGQGLKAASTSSRRSRSSDQNGEEDVAPPPASSAWADFMKEEGAVASKDPEVGEASSDSRKRSHEGGDGDRATSMAKTEPQEDEDVEDLDDDNVFGVLLQTGTLDVAATGRSKVKIENPPAYNLLVPTKLLPSTIKIKSVHTSCNSCHSFAITSSGTVYGWGRNEYGQIATNLPADVILPTVLDGIPSTNGNAVTSAATGKSHSIFLLADGSVYGIGFNKVGQCGVKVNQDKVNTYKKCVFQEKGETTASDVQIKQIACGEDFSIAVSTEGYLFSAGSSEFGQLGNGETGEHIVQAGKTAFANSSSFVLRSTFCHAPEKPYASGGPQKEKVTPIENERILIAKVACGKHHSIAIEKASEYDEEAIPRVFSWGCGAYGCLGHGVQADEYFPRMISSLVNTMKMTAASAKKANKKNGSYTSVSAGAQCSLLQLPNGHVYYWGKHRSIGEATMRPQLVDALANNSHVARHCDAGAQSVLISTANAVTVSWGQGPYGELGLGMAKSSAKPNFVPTLDGCRIASLACGYGHSLFVVRNDDDEDKSAVKKLPSLNHDDCEPIMSAALIKASKREK